MFANGLPPFAACLAWLLLPGWTIYLLGQAIMGEIDPLTAIIVILMTFFIGFNMFAHPNSLVGRLAVWSIYLTVILWFPLRKAIDGKDDKALAAEAVEMTYDTLAMNPDNVIAAFKLAKFMAEKGLIHHADGLAQRVLPSLPKNTFREEHRLATGWQLAAASRTQPAAITCGNCRAVILPGNARCASCGAPWLLDRMRGRRGGGVSPVGKMLVVWAVLLGVLLGMPLLAGQSAAIAVPGALVLVAAAFALVWFAFRPQAQA